MYKSPIDGWGFLFVCAQLASWLRIYRPSLRVSGEHLDIASLPLAQRAAHSRQHDANCASANSRTNSYSCAAAYAFNFTNIAANPFERVGDRCFANPIV